MKALLFIHNSEFIWQGPGYDWPLYPVLWICPYCCQSWAKFSIQGQDCWAFDSGSCERCARPTEFHPVPGSLLDHYMGSGVDCSLISNLPPALLRREWEVHLRSFP